jgi:hypothetical protein
MPLSGTLSVGAWTIRFREKWDMVKIDDLQLGTKKSAETKSKMAAIAAMLDERRRWSLEGTFLQLPPMSHRKIGPFNPGVGEKINGE